LHHVGVLIMLLLRPVFALYKIKGPSVGQNCQFKTLGNILMILNLCRAVEIQRQGYVNGAGEWDFTPVIHV
jgi:hypothetical protein